MSSDLTQLKSLQKRLAWEEACQKNARPNRPRKSHKVGRPATTSLCYSLSDWDVIEAYQRWDGTYAGAERLAGWYGVSYRTLIRAFERLDRRIRHV